MVKWHQTYDKGDRERKPTATTTQATLFLLVTRDLIYSPSHRQDSTNYGLCYTSHGAPPWGIDPMTDHITSRHSTTELHLVSKLWTGLCYHPMICRTFTCTIPQTGQYTRRGPLAVTRNSSMGPPHKGSIRQPITPWANALTTELHLAPQRTDDKANDLNTLEMMKLMTWTHWRW